MNNNNKKSSRQVSPNLTRQVLAINHCHFSLHVSHRGSDPSCVSEQVSVKARGADSTGS